MTGRRCGVGGVVGGGEREMKGRSVGELERTVVEKTKTTGVAVPV